VPAGADEEIANAFAQILIRALEAFVIMPNSQPKNRVSLFDLWLELYPISDEFRCSLAVKAGALFKAYSDRSENLSPLITTDGSLSDKEID